jgi:hypothetical protein
VIVVLSRTLHVVPEALQYVTWQRVAPAAQGNTVVTFPLIGSQLYPAQVLLVPARLRRMLEHPVELLQESVVQTLLSLQPEELSAWMHL